MSRFDEIETILTNLGEAATADQFEFALRDYPDRDVRTVLAERAASAGGGAGVTALGRYNHSGTQTAASGAFLQMTWEASDPPGDTLLDLTDPEAPTMIDAGMYAFNFVFGPSGSATYDYYSEIDIGDTFAIERSYVTGEHVVFASPVLPVEAGDAIKIGVQQTSGSPHNFIFLVYLARLS